MSRLGLSITNIFTIQSEAPVTPPPPIASGGTGEAGLVYLFEYDGVANYTVYETLKDMDGVLTIFTLVNAGATVLPYYNFESNHPNRVSINQIETWVANSIYTVNGTNYTNWEIVTIPSSYTLNPQTQDLVIRQYLSTLPVATSNLNIRMLIKIGTNYHLLRVINQTVPMEYELTQLTFDSNGYIAAENNEFMNFLPGLGRTFVIQNAAQLTKVPVLPSSLKIINTINDTLPNITNTSSLTSYASLLESYGNTSDQLLLTQSSRYRTGNTYLRKNIDPASSFPNSTYPLDNTVVYPLNGPIPTTVTTSNMQINFILNSYTAQQPPAPWYSTGTANFYNLKMSCRVICWGNKFGELPLNFYGANSVVVTGIVGGRLSTILTSGGTRYLETWKFSINLANLNIFPIITNGAVTGYTTVSAKAYNGSESNFKSGVFSLFDIRFTADGYEESDIVGGVNSAAMIIVPMFQNTGSFPIGSNVAQYLATGTTTADTTVINKNRTTANEIPSATPTITVSTDAFGLRPLITG